MLKLKDLSRRRKILLVVALVVATFLTWFLIRLFTIDTELTLVDDYQLPELVSLKNSVEVENDFAVAIDGKIVDETDFESNEPKIRPTASTTKMILSLAIMQEKPFELGESGEILTLSDEDYSRYVWYINHGGSVTAVRAGEEISQYDALASILLASSNNMADTLAIWAFGSIDNYRDYATKMLKEWGINNTTIGEDASGFSESTASTAADLAQIGARVLEDPVLKEIVSTKNYVVPVAGELTNTNGILGQNNIIGVKTGYIGDVSGYCLISGYLEDEHIVTVALLGAPTRQVSFDESLVIVNKMQELAKTDKLVADGQKIGHYESWWTGRVNITATEDLEELAWAEAGISHEIKMDEEDGKLILKIQDHEYSVPVKADEYQKAPTLIEKILHIFGWRKEDVETEEATIEEATEEIAIEEVAESEEEIKPEEETEPFTNAASENCTIKFGKLMLINPNFTVENSFIAERKVELVSIYSEYGIVEGNSGNGDNLLDAEAAEHINDMVNAYKTEYPGHTLETRSCFRSVGTNCGRLCAATGASDHHTGLTCDLLDPAYGTSLDTSTYNQHIDWQWLKANSYKYGFIDRFPEAWAGGSMNEPLNVDENGSTGLFETWHYRYVGVDAATEIATGKYNNGEYDSLEHYLRQRGMVKDLKNGACE